MRKNIFQIGGLVCGDSFIGRKNLLEKLKRDLFSDGSNTNKAIVGLTRTGKTSTIKLILSDLPTNTIGIYEDLKTLSSYFDLWQDIFLSLQNEMTKKGISSDTIQEDLNGIEEDLPWIMLCRTAKRVFEQLANSGIKTVLVLDEFDSASELFENNTSHYELFREIFHDARYNVCGITISRREVHSVEGTTYQGSTFHGVLDDTRLKGFDETDMEEYYSSISEYEINLNDEQKKAIDFYAGNNPYLLSIIGHQIVDTARNGEQIIIEEIVKNKLLLINRYFDDCLNYLVKDGDIERIMPFLNDSNNDIENRDKDELINMGYLRMVGDKTIAVSEYFTLFLIETQKRMTHDSLDNCEQTYDPPEQIINEINPQLDINSQLYEWAKNSDLYRKAIGDVNDTLTDALGQNETNRYIASYKLMETVWKNHIELGLMPDYQLLKEKEFNGEYYVKYRDHLTHMFKVFLLGMFIYENHPVIQQAFSNKEISDDSFLSTWILTALYHDIGYLIETEDGSRDGPEALFVFNRLTDALSYPLNHLFPDTFTEGSERIKQREKNVSPKRVETLSDLVEKLDYFHSYGNTVRLSHEPNRNPIKDYFNFLPLRRIERSYYDHGIVSASILLFMRDALCEYMESAKTFSMYPYQIACVNSFTEQIQVFKEASIKAAIAIALHNIKKDWNVSAILEFGQQSITISEFCIPLEIEPFAYLLRLSDELQCWDRQFFSPPAKSYLMGNALHFEIGDGMVKLVIEKDDTKNKIKEALRGVLDPTLDDCIQLL